ncbi:MAG TPA: AI-2E family transporter, partial [Pirellula sp.]|nr:AI-2E family transporter [Pirellula sp.]
AFVLTPLVLVFEKRRLGRIVSVIIASCMAFAAIGLASWGLAGQLNRLAKDLPNHEQEIKDKMANLQIDEDSTLGRLDKMVKEIFFVKESSALAVTGDSAVQVDSTTKAPVVVAAEPAPTFSKAVDVLLGAVEPFATSALVVVLVLFILIRREDLRYRVISLMGDNALTGTTRLMRDTAERVSNYLFHLLLVNAAFGFWFAIGLYLMNVPYSPLWGFLTLFLRFIPFLGSPASVVFPLLISIATSTGWAQPVSILVFFAISELVTANVIEPILFGKSTGLTPIALLIAALFWAWIWGPIGLLLSTPLTVCLVVLGQHLPTLRSLKVLLAEQPVLDAKLQYFQRLLERDSVEADKLVAECAKELGMERAIDEMLVPALRWTRQEREKESISADEEKFIYSSMSQAFNHTSEIRLPPVPASIDSSSSLDGRNHPSTGLLERNPIDTVSTPDLAKEKLNVVGYPVHNESEEIALGLLQKIATDSCLLTLFSTKQLPSSVLREFQRLNADVIVLAVLPPGGLPQVKYVASELLKNCRNTPIIVSFLGPVKNYDRLLVRLRKSGVSYLATSLSQTRQMIAALQEEKTHHSNMTDSIESSVVPAPHVINPRHRNVSEVEVEEVKSVG